MPFENERGSGAKTTTTNSCVADLCSHVLCVVDSELFLRPFPEMIHFHSTCDTVLRDDRSRSDTISLVRTDAEQEPRSSLQITDLHLQFPLQTNVFVARILLFAENPFDLVSLRRLPVVQLSLELLHFPFQLITPMKIRVPRRICTRRRRRRRSSSICRLIRRRRLETLLKDDARHFDEERKGCLRSDGWMGEVSFEEEFCLFPVYPFSSRDD